MTFNMNTIKTKVLTALSIVAVLLSLVASAGTAKADEFDAQINALKAQINQNQAAANQKRNEADTLQNKLDTINAQIRAAQASLNLTKAQVSKTNQEIDNQNKELNRQRNILKENLRIVYKQGEVTPLEIIASSKNLSDFIAQQQYFRAIKNKIEQNLIKIDQIKKELDNKKAELTSLSAQQQGQVDSIATQQAEQSSILAQTKGDESRYQQSVAQNKQALQAVYASKAASDAANGVGVSVGGSSYPWSNPATFTTQPDPWGFYLRQCVSYVAWKRRQVSNTPYPNYWGSAYQWTIYANSTTPQPGAIAVWGAGVGGTGSDGHVAYVEGVNGDGTMNVSEFNWHPYQYTYRTNVPTRDLQFIY